MSQEEPQSGPRPVPTEGPRPEPAEGPRPACPDRQVRELAEGQAALLNAIKAGDVAGVRTLLDGHPGLVEVADQNGDMPLLLAAYYHADEIVHLLLQRGAPMSVFEAAATGYADRVRRMLDDQPELLTSISHDGWTPLHLAAHFGRLDVVNLLLARGAEVDARSTNVTANTPLHAALAGAHPAAARRLIDRGADVNAVEAGGYTPLHQAADQGDAEMVRVLLERGARPDPQTDDGDTPRDLARAKGHVAVAEQLDHEASASG
jgi:ankyrin repeat protein